MSTSCRRFHHCNVPLRPLDPESLTTGRWFPSEQICHRSSALTTKQRKLARLGLDDKSGYFSAAMLDVDFIVRRGIHGLDPEKPSIERERDEVRWLAAHPGISLQRMAQMRKQAAHARLSSFAFPNKKRGSHKDLSSLASKAGSSVLPNGTGLENGLMREER